MAPAFDVFLDRLMLLQVIVFMWGGIVTHVGFVSAELGCGLWDVEVCIFPFPLRVWKKAKDNLYY